MFRARDFRDFARQALRGFWGLTIAVTLVAALLGATTSSFPSLRLNVNIPQQTEYETTEYETTEYETTEFDFSKIPFSQDPRIGILASQAVIVLTVILAAFGLLWAIIGGAAELGLARYNLDLLTKENPPAFRTLFSRFSIWGKAFGLRFMTGLFTALWMLLLIVPGIIAAYRYAMAPYLMAEYPEMGVREAIAKSKELMQGNKGRLFCLQLSFIGWQLLSALTLGIGGLWLMPYQNAATAAFYLDVTNRAKVLTGEDAAEAPKQIED